MNPRRYTIETLLDEVVTLPSLPASVEQIMRLINDPMSSLGRVAKAVHADPALTMKALRLVNSAYYALPQKITSVDYAVTMLGVKVIKNLVLSATAFEVLRKNTEDLFRHSLSVAVATRVLATTHPAAGAIEAEEGFVFGLLHDVGKILFAQYLPKETENAMLLARSKAAPVYLAEREVIGVDHAELGAELARKWGLSDALVDAIAGHHDLARCPQPPHRPLAALLAIADYAVTASGIPSVPKVHVEIADEMWIAAEMSNEDVAGFLDAFFASFRQVEELVEMAS